MQKAIRFVAVILAFMMLFGIAACEKGENTEHEDPQTEHQHTLGDWETDGTSHWKVCSECGAKADEGACTAGNTWKSDAEEHWHECTVCGGRMDEEAHVYYTKYDEICATCGAERDMVTVTYKDGEDIIDTITISKGSTADDFFVDYCTVIWMKDGKEFDLDTLVTEDITLTAGAKVEHEHAFTWHVGEGDDVGFDIGECECGKTEKLSTVLAPEELQYIDMTAESEEVLFTLPEGMTAVSLKFGNKEIGTAENGKAQIDPSAVFAADEYGLQELIVVGKGEDGAEHAFTLPVIAVTKFIRTTDDLGAVKYTTENAVIEGYFALANDIDGQGTTISSSLYAWSGDNGFCGTFDGRGFTISNITVTGCGIFGHLGKNAVVRNVNFDAVSLGGGIWPDTCGAPLFARVAANFSLLEDITVNYVSIYTNDSIAVPEYGLLVSRQMNVGDENPNDPLLKNITLNAKGLVVPNAFGLTISDRIKFENVIVNAGGVTLLGASDAFAEQALTEIPGVTVRLPKEITAFAAAESGETQLTLTSDIFKTGETATVILNGSQKQLNVEKDGELTLTLADFSVTDLGKLGVSVLLDDQDYIFSDVWYVTKVIKQFSDLSELSNVKNARNTGYYILGNDILGEGSVLDGGGTTAWSQNEGFGGTFDGRGCTIKNFSVSGNGIFGGLGLGTVKNVNFEDVTLNAGSALLARTMYNSTVKDVTLKLTAFLSTSGECGVFVKRQSGTYASYSNIVVDANGCDIYNVLGQQFDVSRMTVENFVINNAGTITYFGTSDTSDTPIEQPAGMTVNYKTAE